jgi:hypothetical protein
MKKTNNRKDTLRTEYNTSDFPDGVVRGKYAKKAATASNVVVLDPEVAAAFPTSASVNDALRALVKVAKHIKPAA